MPIKFVKPLSVVEKQVMILKTFDLKENDCVCINTEERYYGKNYDEYKIIKIEEEGYVLKKLASDYVAPLTYLLNLPWTKVPQITEFGNCKCEDVDCKECPLLYINHKCHFDYMERWNDCKASDVKSYTENAIVDIKAKRNKGLHKDTVRQVYDHFINLGYFNKCKHLINWNAAAMELEKAADVIEEEGVTYFKKRETEEEKTE